MKFIDRLLIACTQIGGIWQTLIIIVILSPAVVLMQYGPLGAAIAAFYLLGIFALIKRSKITRSITKDKRDEDDE